MQTEKGKCSRRSNEYTHRENKKKKNTGENNKLTERDASSRPDLFKQNAAAMKATRKLSHETMKY